MPVFRYSLGRMKPLSVPGYREAARRALPAVAFAYLDGGADDLTTLNQNRAAFGRWTLRQRVLAGVNAPNLATTIAGTDLSMPLMLAPTGLSGLTHWSGDPAAARAAERAGTRLVVSTSASYSLEEIAEATAENHWFQLYPFGDRDLTARLIARAKAAGYVACAVTVDVPTIGNREGERRTGMGIPPTITPRRALDVALRPRWAYGFLRERRMSLRNLVEDTGFRAATASVAEQVRMLNLSWIRWEDFEWIREQWEGPLFIKGILDPDDAEHAVEVGADGVIVSNHGGRQLDGALATLDALPAIVERVGDRMTVLLDGGVRRGTDVVKALCLGAQGVLIGRAFLYGLAVAGEAGVADVLRILREELNRALVLMGCPGVEHLDRSWLV
jgi:L-lactate dehydrogenase (cytochrome)/(S)-mandelate dehydrogenase